MMLAVYCLFWIIHLIHGKETDLSLLTTDQTQIWSNAVSNMNTTDPNPRIAIIRVGKAMDISLYEDQDGILAENRHLFKQNIHKRVDCYLYKNQVNSSNIYDTCRGALSLQDVSPTIAGIYVYTRNQTGHALGLILVEITESLYWFNSTKPYLFDRLTVLRNGTQLSLAFKLNIYYNSNSDLILLNTKINDIIQQANVSVKPEVDNNLETFLSIDNFSCQRHQQIVYDDLRLLKIVCTTEVTFKCPLKSGSTCWIEDKRLSNIQFHIDSHIFTSDKTITVRIDV